MMTTPPSTNGILATEITQEQLQEAETWLDEVSLTNLEETAPLPIKIRLQRYVTVEETDEETGETFERRTLKSRLATIERYVPMTIYNRMLATLGRLQHRSEKPTEQEWLAFVSEQVLAVWQLSEPAMTAEELAEGINLDQQQALFNLFFGDLLKKGRERARPK